MKKLYYSISSLDTSVMVSARSIYDGWYSLILVEDQYAEEFLNVDEFLYKVLRGGVTVDDDGEFGGGSCNVMTTVTRVPRPTMSTPILALIISHIKLLRVLHQSVRCQL